MNGRLPVEDNFVCCNADTESKSGNIIWSTICKGYRSFFSSLKILGLVLFLFYSFFSYKTVLQGVDALTCYDF